MILHALNNGLMLSLAYWGEELKSLGLDVEDQQHLPLAWAATAAGLAAIGLVLAHFGRRPDAPVTSAPDNTLKQLAAPPEPNAG
jgi:hypothetical protein